MIDSISMSAGLRAPGLETRGPSQISAGSGADFSEVLSNVASGAVASLRSGEAAAISGLRGSMPIQDVVEAVMSAERSLQTALSLRDKAVGAYQEISRMQI